ncbi:hypothetical protein [Ralstonia pseudosolanacearum]|uniref:hypothetical protein n=1 Tax=Ralstonia pseudosolanacearum TaxID=1310165 RepID=UPI003CF32179
MSQFATPAQIEEFLTGQGLEKDSTGGGFSAWFLSSKSDSNGWKIMITDWDTDTAELQPGKKIGIGLYAPDGGGPEDVFEIVDSAELLPEALERFKKAAIEKFGTGSISNG